VNLAPVRARSLRDGDAVFVADTGRFFAGSAAFLERTVHDRLNGGDEQFLRKGGFCWDDADELTKLAHARDFAQRFAVAPKLDYLILVPTLRCNLSCSYCQVSRADEHQIAYDWSDETHAQVLALIDGLEADFLKIEFQGGEPTLRPDLLKTVIESARRGRTAKFVICTNLSRLDQSILELLDDPDVSISTSLDGDHETHRHNRTATDERTGEFERHLEFVLSKYGPGKVSALPTINPENPPDPDTLIDSYARRGLTSIFLRPINYHGFARKRHKGSREHGPEWQLYYETFVRKLIERNYNDPSICLEETYLSLCLKRVFRSGLDRHVDLRNPNPIGVDYVVVDYDGRVYPTDEARMLTRAGVIDLSIGDVAKGWDSERREVLNQHASNTFDPDCETCAFQPYCGRDVIDDIARYGRIDMPRTETAFCKRHLHLFDFIFELIYSDDPAIQYSLRRWLNVSASYGSLGARRS
jgi:His-Xaa-Ser system radical SAM maturase HxsB